MNKDPNNIAARVKNAVQSAGISYGDTLIVGVSGGPDSVALLHVLLALRPEWGISLHVAHFNHGWRKSAAADENFVRTLAQQWQVPCSFGRMPKRLAGVQSGREERGRSQRFDFFRRVAERNGGRAVALGHTQDDLAETVLMHILRGTGLQGMRGILPQRELHGVRLIRPLLGIRKRDILGYLRNRGIAYRKDPSNLRQDFFRNKLRLELIPLLEKRYNPGIRPLLANLADTASEDYDYIEGQAQKVFARMGKYLKDKRSVRFDRRLFLRQPKAVRRMLIRQAVERLQCNMNRLALVHVRQIEEMVSKEAVGFRIHLPAGIRVVMDAGCMEIFLRSGGRSRREA